MENVFCIFNSRIKYLRHRSLNKDRILGEVEPKKKFKKPSKDEKRALEKLVLQLKKVSQNTPAEEIQTMIYSIGKENGYKENLRDWFKLIYQVTFGEENGPRMGFFISFFGVKETIDLMEKKLKI